MLKTGSAVTRREFGLAVCCLPLELRLFAAEQAAMPWNEPATVARVYLAAPQAHWPKPDLDVSQEVREIEARLSEVARRSSDDVRLIGGEIMRTEAEVAPWLAQLGAVDGVLIIPVTQPTPPLRPMVEQLKVPALLFSRPYASHVWSSIAGFRAAGRRVDVLATSNYGDLDPYLRIFRTAHHLRTSKVLVGVANPASRQSTCEAYRQQFGTSFQFVSGQQFVDAFKAVDERAAQKAADELVRGALRVVEPGPKDIQDAMRFHLALAQMLRSEKANAITIDCFGSLAANTLPGYPCIAWSKFNDQGLYGVCECDLPSTMTQMLITSYSRMPGFVSDPVFDISRNEVIHAHCVGATRMKGINGPSAPYIVRNHLETNEGATIQVMMPSGETITVARFVDPSKMLISTAEVTGAVDSDRGCRTQIRTRVSDAEKWIQHYSAGLHRVIFYGDHVRTVERMGRLLGFDVVREVA
jgi:hypothetical protein